MTRIGLTKVKATAQRLIKQHPDWRNATIGGGCVYEDDRGRRCFVGEVLHALGVPMPKDVCGAKNPPFRSSRANAYVLEGYLTRQAVAWLGDVQPLFDQWEYEDEEEATRPVKWGSAAATLKACGWL